MTKLVSLLLASSTEPMPAALRTERMTRVYEALRSIQEDEKPKTDAWQELAFAVQITCVLIKSGPWHCGTEEITVQDSSGLLDDAMNALSRAGIRRLEGKPIRFDGPGLAAIRAVLEDYKVCIESISYRSYVRAGLLAKKRFK